MMEEGMLSIVRRGDTYQVRYASTNPYDMECPLAQYVDEGTLTALLHDWGIDTWSIQQAIATMWGGGMAVLYIRFTAAGRSLLPRTKVLAALLLGPVLHLLMHGWHGHERTDHRYAANTPAFVPRLGGQGQREA